MATPFKSYENQITGYKLASKGFTHFNFYTYISYPVVGVFWKEAEKAEKLLGWDD